ncbi:MAG: MmcQ/YjbR family DNA-binding protein [Myxococcales bacterium]|nr:MmcQ/YjbR family DNA-binding protein [Myxococcales bacterium]MDD9968025.1 MmcQ/YjbR family DNA-binding protein [Myxococcales bacterium]
MRWEKLSSLGQELPEVTEETWYRTPALKVRGKGFVRLKEDGRSVVFMLGSVDEQQFLIGSQPDLYYITSHYVGWPAVLARLAKLRVAEARQRIEESWRVKAPKTLIKRFDTQ